MGPITPPRTNMHHSFLFSRTTAFLLLLLALFLAFLPSEPYSYLDVMGKLNLAVQGFNFGLQFLRT